MNWKELRSRYQEMQRLARYVAKRSAAAETVRLLFVCTHNARRSQLACAMAPYIWHQLVTEMDSDKEAQRIEAYSGGSEVTRVHPNTIRALIRSGYSLIEGSPDVPSSEAGSSPTISGSGSVTVSKHTDIQDTDSDVVGNSIYRLQDPRGHEMELFSKLLDHPQNPGSHFAAIMVCSNADEACPFVPGADVRISLPFEDPGKFDNTERSAEAYDSAMEAIARDLYSTFAMALGNID